MRKVFTDWTFANWSQFRLGCKSLKIESVIAISPPKKCRLQGKMNLQPKAQCLLHCIWRSTCECGCTFSTVLRRNIQYSYVRDGAVYAKIPHTLFPGVTFVALAKLTLLLTLSYMQRKERQRKSKCCPRRCFRISIHYFALSSSLQQNKKQNNKDFLQLDEIFLLSNSTDLSLEMTL